MSDLNDQTDPATPHDARLEIWRPVVGHEGKYEVSNIGRVRSLERSIAVTGHYCQTSRTIRPRILRQCFDDAGYLRVTLQAPTKKERIHVLVLEAFIGPRPSGMFGCHNNDIPDDNKLENLRWDTPSANSYDAIRHGRNHFVNRERCPRGHLLVAPNLRKRPDDRRECRACGLAYGNCREAKKRGIELDFTVVADRRYLEVMGQPADVGR